MNAASSARIRSSDMTIIDGPFPVGECLEATHDQGP